MKLKILLEWVFLFINLFIYWIVDSVLLLQAQVSHMAVCLTGKETQRAALLWPVLISCSEQINVWWIMFSAVFQEDRELLSKRSVSWAFRCVDVPLPGQIYLVCTPPSPLLNTFISTLGYCYTVFVVGFKSIIQN